MWLDARCRHRLRPPTFIGCTTHRGEVRLRRRGRGAARGRGRGPDRRARVPSSTSRWDRQRHLPAEGTRSAARRVGPWETIERKGHNKTGAGGWSARPGVARPIAEPIALWRMTERLIASPPCRGEANGAAFVVLRDPSRVRMAFDPTMPARVRPERQLRERVSPLDRSKSPVFLIASHGPEACPEATAVAQGRIAC